MTSSQKSPDPEPLTIEVGKSYQDASGRKVTITIERPANNWTSQFIYRFIGNVGKSYSPDGKCRTKGNDRRFDLLFEV